jgi:SWI/SNF-related matrix-associated actin-dependent regulator of chromatin subfamily A3
MGPNRNSNVSLHPHISCPATANQYSVNSVKDLHSLVRFLHITGGIEQSEIFNAQISRKLDSGDSHGEKLLQALMHDLCLRRRKDMKFVDLKLPAKKEYIHRIAFRKDEKRKYDALL